MDYTYHIPVKVWIEIGHAFFDAYVRFCTEGTDSHRFKINNRNIEITFLIATAFLTSSSIVPRL